MAVGDSDSPLGGNVICCTERHGATSIVDAGLVTEAVIAETGDGVVTVRSGSDFADVVVLGLAGRAGGVCFFGESALRIVGEGRGVVHAGAAFDRLVEAIAEIVVLIRNFREERAGEAAVVNFDGFEVVRFAAGFRFLY